MIAVSVQAYFLFRQIKADHEKARREKAVDLLLQWSKELKEESALARKIVEKFDQEQCRGLFRQEPIKIKTKDYNLLEGVLKELYKHPEEASEDTTLNEAQVSKLRWHIVTYLNSLESVLVAWQYSVVDRKIIERQFSYVLRPEDGHDALKFFRVAAGDEKCYPATEIFCTHLQEERKKELIQKGNVF